MVDIIDENDNVIDTVARSEMRKKNLLHRTVYFMVLNSKGEMLIAKRSETKDIDPGVYETPGACVSHGESYELAAQRELEEEFGIKNAELKFLFDFSYKDETRNSISRVYSCIYDGEIIPQEEEVDEYSFVSPEELKKMVREGKKKFAPQRILLLEKYFGEKLQ